MRFLILTLLIFVSMVAFGQKPDSLKSDTLLSGIRHEFLEKQFNYCVYRIDKLENQLDKIEGERNQEKYWIIGFIILALVALRLGWLDKLQKKS